MNLDEFKAWLDGFEESFKSNEDGIYPDGRQYAKIKGKLKEINIPHGPSYGLNYPPNVRDYVQQPLGISGKEYAARQRAFDALAQRQHSVSSEDIDNYLAKEERE